ncbi:hypothetical protein H6G96_31525, partial [Nostoc sp. FACHB-892]|uniref:hypothetical protein n=1 Tax=Nostoc sp. FACHB-892 TaxID=2692843 RepID=UPI0016867A7B
VLVWQLRCRTTTASPRLLLCDRNGSCGVVWRRCRVSRVRCVGVGGFGLATALPQRRPLRGVSCDRSQLLTPILTHWIFSNNLSS